MRIALAGLGLTLLATPLRAQAPGLPVMNSGLIRGFTIAGLVGFPNDAAGDGTPLAASATFGARRVGVGGFVSRIGGSDDNHYSYGGNLIVKLAGGPLVPIAINLQAGAAYYRTSLGTAGSGKLTTIHAPVGLSLSWTFARPVVAIKPWIAPRLDLTRVDAPDNALALVDRTDSEFGLSGGLTFGFLNGLNLDIAVDRVFTNDLTSKPTTIGAGLSFTIK